MATATAKRSQQDEDHEPERWAMPKPRLHQIVAWFPHAQRSFNSDGSTRAQPALVTEVGESAVTLVSLSPDKFGQWMGAVHHCDDPDLAENDFVRKQYGGWEFTEYDKQLESERKQSSERLHVLETQVSGIRKEVADRLQVVQDLETRVSKLLKDLGEGDAGKKAKG